MAEDQDITLLQKVAGPLVVASLVGLVAFWGATGTRLSLVEHRVEQLESFKNLGNWCTGEQCAANTRRLEILDNELNSHERQSAHDYGARVMNELTKKIEALESKKRHE